MHVHKCAEGQGTALQLPGVREGGPLARNAAADAGDVALRRTLLYMASRRGGGRGRLLRLGQLEAMDVPEVSHSVLHGLLQAKKFPSLHKRWPLRNFVQNALRRWRCRRCGRSCWRGGRWWARQRTPSST